MITTVASPSNGSAYVTTRAIAFRMNYILTRLRQSQRAITARELAEGFETTTKTIYRDMAYLKSMGAVKVLTRRDGFDVDGYELIDLPVCPWCGQTPNVAVSDAAEKTK